MQNRLFSFMNPLALDIWFLMAMAYIFVSLTIWMVARLSPVEWRNITSLCYEYDEPSDDVCPHSHSHSHNAIDMDRDNMHIDNLMRSNSHHNSICHTDNHDHNAITAFNQMDVEDNDDIIVDKDDEYLGCNETHDDIHLNCYINEFTLFNSFWFTIGTLMQQGSDLNPKVVFIHIISMYKCMHLHFNFLFLLFSCIHI